MKLPNKLHQIWEYTSSNSIYFLAAALLLFLIVPPFLENEYAFRNSILVLTTIIVGFVILILPSKNKNQPVIRGIMAILILFPWLMDRSIELKVIVLFAFALLYSLTSWRIILIVFDEEKVDLKVIVGSVVGYLMIGLSFTFVCALLELFYPNAFTDQMTSSYSFIYYTFVTLSTLGYGDIVPATPQSQALSLIIAIFGQFYMVIVVAVIVGKYISGRKPA